MYSSTCHIVKYKGKHGYCVLNSTMCQLNTCNIYPMWLTRLETMLRRFHQLKSLWCGRWWKSNMVQMWHIIRHGLLGGKLFCLFTTLEKIFILSSYTSWKQCNIQIRGHWLSDFSKHTMMLIFIFIIISTNKKWLVLGFNIELCVLIWWIATLAI